MSIQRRTTKFVRALTTACAGTLAAVVVATLAGAGTAHATGAPPLLSFNHAYGVFDRETADAIEHSGYLRTFANLQIRTTTGSGDETWTGRYLMGRETYLELFGTGDVPGKDGELGAGGMGVSTENEGELPTVVQRLRELGVANPVQLQQTRDFGDGVPVPWFDAVFTTGEYDTFGAWGMEYLPGYFADPRSDTEPPSHPGDVGRERYLPDGYRDHLMRDVTGVRLAMTQRDLDSTTPLLRAGGMTVTDVPGGVLATGSGTAIRLEAVPVDRTGMRQADFALNHPVHYRHVERIGHSTLVVGPGAQARWTFDAR
ncbi:DUF5829 family protein [Amycolatopsis jiangsuensis]|uniref:Uncharacterized protein n=1 Tax=Amycolatopsis jiangsuensis TaxID=1181879 RepID=A0A840IP59_9PSEU|nr:DUF5829 family protein [Amycolatopsis jiangsuensis]MBB4682854.1 hypothetical protein [Amycolatopsis jiangsuensis]